MRTFPLLFSLLFIFFIQHHLQAVAELCSTFSCNQHRRDPILFPFWVPDNQTSRCGYPGFGLSCNSAGQTLLPFKPDHLIVQGISYPDQLIWVSDPNHCIPKRVLEFSYSELMPFGYGPYDSAYTFLNCSGPKVDPDQLPGGVSVISCMSGGNYTVVVAFDDVSEAKMRRKCEVVKKVNAAFWWRGMEYGVFPMDMSDVFVQLSWDVPSCVNCMLRGGSCGLVGDSGLEVGCYLPASSGLPKSAKYGLMLGAGIPGFLCIIGLTFYISSRVSARNQNRHYSNTESSPSIFPQPIIITLGLDAPTIESYPKTILGESKRLPKPSDNTCPICLSEYEPKETLRSIPDCNHYFHAECIDEWLRMNATCPLCRNSPQASSALAGS
ncbi:putative RING-H2 finger protein ATL21A [Chenopodium quinoa]|uniref:RING-type E3 ubiquitin transferase n=1 Tax=Chenopodium quinoa TaxID=63459 RepID=A0A803LWI7_CHEQI|nr:putative RING-H2 finger protein ATL21A [Chenopodium quinoa]